jgi:hypothetical protein
LKKKLGIFSKNYGLLGIITKKLGKQGLPPKKEEN